MPSAQRFLGVWGVVGCGGGVGVWGGGGVGIAVTPTVLDGFFLYYV